MTKTIFVIIASLLLTASVNATEKTEQCDNAVRAMRDYMKIVVKLGVCQEKSSSIEQCRCEEQKNAFIQARLKLAALNNYPCGKNQKDIAYEYKW